MDKACEKLCKAGEKADQLYVQGRYKEAHNAYLQLIEELEKQGLTDSYLLSKITLGVLLTHIKTGQFQNAFAIWNSNLEDSLYGIGIYGLESAQTTVEDMVIYDFICAYLHSLSKAPPAEAANAINQYMSRVCEYAEEKGDRALYAMAISNWKQHLKDVFRGAIPQNFARAVIACEQKFGDSVRLQPIEFPTPTAWGRPNDFNELSRMHSFEMLGFDVPTKKIPSKKRSA